MDAERAITDQFGDKSLVLDALMKKGRTIELVQQPRAEEDMAVAAASILARAEFLDRLRSLSRKSELELPKGASPMVEEAAVKLVKALGPGALGKCRKTAFQDHCPRSASAAG